MKKRRLFTMIGSLLLVCLLSTGARAMEHDMLKVGLKYGSDAMYSANLQNYNDAAAGRGYAFGYYDYERSFVPLGPVTDEYKITVTVDGNFYASGSAYYAGAGGVGGWHLRLAEDFATCEEAAEAAARYDGAFVAYLIDACAVYIGQYYNQAEADAALAAWTGEDAAETVSPGSTGVVVTATGTNRVLFYFDCGGLRSLAVEPLSINGEKPVTWFRGYRYYGGFEYQRVTGGNLNVVNVVNVEDYVKGVVGWEIGNDKPLEAIKAQAVCARTYAAMQTRHRSQGFDVCSTEDCQVYQGLTTANEITDRAVDETAGDYMYYNGKYVEAYYYSCNGGASEDAKNVWNEDVGYLKGKEDPYEAYIASRIPKYNWSTTFTRDELKTRLSARGIDVGTVQNVYVSEYTPTGNVLALTFAGSSGTKTVYREACRTILNLRSMRFTTGAGGGASYYVNDSGGTLPDLRDLFAIFGRGEVSKAPSAELYVITASGTAKLDKGAASTTGDFTFTGSGWGHNVGMSQWGAVAMAEQGFSYREILQFYYTGVTIQ